jgi:methionyl-tRNA formyltransferase
VLRITELQAEGKRRMSAADFLNASSLLNMTLK